VSCRAHFVVPGDAMMEYLLSRRGCAVPDADGSERVTRLALVRRVRTGPRCLYFQHPTPAAATDGA
jgi:hypothetical protein